MKKSHLVGGAAVVLVALYASPYWALHQLKKAAEAGDAVELNDRVDFPAVRESLKGTLSAEFTKSMDERLAGNMFAGLATAMAGTVVNKLVDQLVTPEAISNLVKMGRPKASSETTTSPSKDEDDGTRVSRGYKGWDRFELRVNNAIDQSGATFTLRRENLFFWRLKHIDLRLPSKGTSGD